MRKAKRLIALLTVALFLFTFAIPAGAATFSDLSGSKATKDIYRLNALGIINGYPDGSFKPDANITRAEFAVIAMSAAGLKNSADILKNNASKFSDVKAGEWYTGWVNLAASQGYIAGYPDGTFKPNANISYAECITILVRILGYNEKLPGVWPTEYIVKAAELGITDDVTFNASGLAIRGDIAILTSATLDENLVVFDKDTDEFKNKYTPAVTLFADKFDGATYDEEDLYVTGWGTDSDGQFTVSVASIVYGDNPNTYTTIETNWLGPVTMTLAKDVVINGIANVPSLGGHQVEMNINTDDSEITYLTVTSKAITAEKADVKVDGSGLKIKDVKYSYADNFIGTKITAAGEITAPYYKVFLNEDGEMYKIETPGGGSPRLADEYNTTTKKLAFKNASTIELKDQDVLVIKDGKVAKAEDIKENDVVYVKDSGMGSLEFYLDVKTVSASGKLEAGLDLADDEYGRLKIGGKKFYVADTLLLSTNGGDDFSTVDASADIDDVYNLDVKYFLDKQNKVAFIISDKLAADKNNYGILTEINDETLAGKITKVKILKPDNTEVIYDINTAEIVIDWDGTEPVPSDPDVVLEGDGDWAVRYTLDSNGKIDDIEELGYPDALTEAVKDSNKLYIDGKGWYYLDSNTKILNGRDDEDAATESNSDILKYLEDTDALDAYVKTSGNKVTILLLNADLGVTAENKAMVVSKYYKNGKLWIDVDVRGTLTSYEAASGTVAASVYTDELYEYTMSGTKIALGDMVDLSSVTTLELKDKDSTHKSIKVVVSGVNKWLEIDADTYIYDLTDSDPVYKTFEDLSIGDNIKFIEVEDDDDRVGVIDVLYIVD